MELGSGRIIREATEDDILAYVQGEDFAILSTDPNTYIQCAEQKEPPYEYVLECQHGSLEQHYRAADGRITLDRVLSAFRKYLRGDVSWNTDFRWERALPASPQREFEKLDRALSAPETDPLLATEVARIKRMTIEHNARVNWTIGALLIAGVVIGGAVWFIQRPRDRDDTHLGLALGLGGATFCIGCILCRMVFPKPSAECPQCGCDWNIESENDIQKWLTWHCCPGCGLKMRDDTGCHDMSRQKDP